MSVRLMHRFLNTLIWLMLAFVVAGYLPTVHAADGKRILLLTPESRRDQGLQEFYGQLHQSLEEAGNVTLYHESLDLQEFPHETYRQNLARWFRDKYKNVPPDVIIVTGQQALRFSLQYEKWMWPGTPVVFSLASDVDVIQMNLPPHFNGKVLRANFSNVVHVVKTLLPGTKRLVLTGSVPPGELNRTFFRQQALQMSDELSIQDLRHLPLADVLEEIRKLPAGSVIFQGLQSADRASARQYGADLLQAVLAQAQHPVIVDEPGQLGKGPLVALSFDFSELAKETAALALKAKAGKEGSHDLISSGFIPLLDNHQAERWQIPDSRLPAGTQRRFYTPTIWEAYRWYLIAAFATFLLLLIAVIALVIERRLHSSAVDASRQVLSQITQMNRKMTASIYNEAIGHELMQPLAAILSNVEAAMIFLKREPPAYDLLHETLQNIRRDNLRADELIRNMKGLLTKSDTELTPVDINWLVRKVLNFLSIEAKVRRIQIRDNLGPDGMLVSINIVQLQQVLVNLILNSMDAIDRKKGKERVITLETSLYASDQVRISVVDTGTGFDQGVERVFESFFTTKPEGVGLGLWISASIVQAHGGHIWAENRLGGGIMRFKLPLLRGHHE
ncbi:ATP-binding protein [Undibacterium squillarum]|nr:ATP-binding protein [Undibacterium squillarum]